MSNDWKMSEVKRTMQRSCVLRDGRKKTMELAKRMILNFHGWSVDALRFVIPQELHVAESRGFITLLIIQSIQDNGEK